jgi:hypothetical protein
MQEVHKFYTESLLVRAFCPEDFERSNLKIFTSFVDRVLLPRDGSVADRLNFVCKDILFLACYSEWLLYVSNATVYVVSVWEVG